MPPSNETRAQARRALIADANETETRDDRDEGHRLWRGLVDGRWTFRDSFEVGESRFLVAARNPHVDPAFVLTWTERRVAALIARGHSVKVTAIELELSDSRVSQSLSQALRKLGLRSRGELITTCGEIAPNGLEAASFEPGFERDEDGPAPPAVGAGGARR